MVTCVSWRPWSTYGTSNFTHTRQASAASSTWTGVDLWNGLTSSTAGPPSMTEGLSGLDWTTSAPISTGFSATGYSKTVGSGPHSRLNFNATPVWTLTTTPAGFLPTFTSTGVSERLESAQILVLGLLLTVLLHKL